MKVEKGNGFNSRRREASEEPRSNAARLNDETTSRNTEMVLLIVHTTGLEAATYGARLFDVIQDITGLQMMTWGRLTCRCH